MISLIIYCKDHKRQPVRLGFSPAFQDAQAELPLAWCFQCGSEVFDRGQDRCIRCRRVKGEN